MYRIVASLFLLVASTVVSSAQGLWPSVWQGQRGSILKVLWVGPAGNFGGVFITSPAGPCPAVPTDLGSEQSYPVQCPDIEDLDRRLPRDRGLGRAPRQPDDPRDALDRDLCRPGRPSDPRASARKCSGASSKGGGDRRRRTCCGPGLGLGRLGAYPGKVEIVASENGDMRQRENERRTPILNWDAL